MKNIFHIAILSSFLMLMPLVSQAQTTYKFGHLDLQEVLVQMPKYKAAETKLKTFQEQLVKAATDLEAEYTKLMKDYELAQSQNLPKAVMDTKASSIQDLMKRMQNLELSSQQQIMEEQVRLLTPIETDLMGAIKAVAAEGGYTYIFDSSVNGSVLFSPDNEDVSDKVKAKLGI